MADQPTGTSTGWFCVDAVTGQPVGPYDVRVLQGMLSAGHVTFQTPVWCEGQPEWLPLEDVPALQPVVGVVRDLQQQAAGQQQPGQAVDELAVFQAEIAQLEAGGGGADEEAGAGDAPHPGNGTTASDGGGAGPPTPDELEFEDDDGTNYVWDRKLRKYMPAGGADVAGVLGVGAAAGYNEADMVFTAEEEVLPSLGEAAEGAAAATAAAGQKRPAADDVTPAAVKAPAAKKGKKGKKEQAPAPRVNTSIYINGLPDDVTVEELHEAVSRYGLVKEDEARQPRIKLYKDPATGALKGDALVTYLREPSVQLAVNLMDGMQLRPGQGAPLSVQPAKFEPKPGGAPNKPGGAGPTTQKQMSKKAKLALQARQERLLGWGGLDDRLPAEKVTVVLFGMFKPAELAAELGAAAELEAEVAAEAGTLGQVEKVRVFKAHPEGVVSIKFKTAEAAAACRARMDGRFFGGTRIQAQMYDGYTNYAAVKVQETAEEQEARLEAYARELEARAAARAAAAAAATAGGGEPAGDGQEGGK